MKSETITLKETITGYIHYLAETGKADRTIYTYGKDLQQIERFFGAERHLDSINKLQVGKFMNSSELLALPDGRPRAWQTVRKTYRVLKKLLEWAKTKGMSGKFPSPSGPCLFQTIRTL